jgi:outer membrane biosynthesis protein TonB
MAKYEVFIPAAMASEFNVTLKVDADNWMAALKSGLTRLGEKGTQVTNIMVDIMEDNSIHVSDMASGRVFRIKELEEAAAPVAAVPIPLSAPAPIQLSAPAPAPAPAPVATEARTLQDMPVVEAPAPVAPAPPRVEAPAPKPVAAPAPRPVEPLAAPKPVAPPAAKPAPKPVEARPAPKPVEARPAAKAPASEPARPRPSGEAQRVEQVASPSAPISGPIGRSRT